MSPDKPYLCRVCGRRGPYCISEICPPCYAWAIEYVKAVIRWAAVNWPVWGPPKGNACS